MFRARVVLLSTVFVVAAVLAACGDDKAAAPAETLPPLNTTTTASTSTTVYEDPNVQKYYVVQAGDTLSKIADSFDVRQEDLMTLNGITDPDKIEIGQELQIPTGKVVLDSLPTPAAGDSSTSSTQTP
jgi:LysM repeat protein